MSLSRVDVIRLGQLTKTRLVTLKRRTGIDTWNVLCRWAFCLSLADAAPVSEHHDDPGTDIEMTWKTFAGEYTEVYEALVLHRAESEQIELNVNSEAVLLRRHIVRGVARLVARRDLGSISDFLGLS